MNRDTTLIAVKGALAAARILADRGLEQPSELTRLLAHLPEVEWSGVRHGQGSGNDGHPYAACPVCGGLREPNGEFIEEAVGHQPGCRLAFALGVPTRAAQGQEELPV